MFKKTNYFYLYTHCIYLFISFQISPICVWRYVCASALGLFPTQVISVYLGTTVRSMEEVLVDENAANVGYGVLILQVWVYIDILCRYVLCLRYV